MSDSLAFNINNKIKLKLTEHGASVLKKEHDALMKSFPEKLRHEFKLELNEDGEWEEQLWVVMNRLGPSLYNGGKLVIKGNDIVLPLP